MRLLETPVPIPNTTVKRKTAEGTMLVTVWENRRAPDYYGGVAQLGEHLPCKQGVRSSILLISTTFYIGPMDLYILYLDNYMKT